MKLIFGLLAVSCWLSAASADPLWARTYSGPYSYDEIHAIGVDDSGNVVVSGFSDLSGSNEEFVTIKYRPDGDTAWLRHFDPGSGLDGATALAVDRSGNVLVTGYLGSSSSEYGDWVTIKYSAAGESLWTAVYDLGSEDRPSAIAVDSAGNSYVTGEAGSPNYFDFALVKYWPDGETAWSFIYDGEYNDGAEAVAVDNNGNAYLTGYTLGSSGYADLLTCKISPAGESLWTNAWDGPAGRWDRGTAITVDGSGNVIAAGFTNDASNRPDYITIKYAPSGETLWTRRYNGPGNLQDYLAGLVLDNAGNVYVTGGSYADNSHYDYATIKYGPDGTERWLQRYPGVTHRASASAIALDADANVYVTGVSVDSTGGLDIVTVKYDSAGNQRWVQRYNHPSVYDEAYVLAVSRQGNVFVGGRTRTTSGCIDYLTLAYGTVTAVQERPAPNATCFAPGPTIVRNTLNLPSASCNLQSPIALLDAAGRKVLDLVPGANDVSCLAPGVYFVRSGPDVIRVVVSR